MSYQDNMEPFVDHAAISGEALMWEANLDVFYELMLRDNLQSPSMTVQWLPGVTTSEDNDLFIYRLILGTQTETDENYLVLATITIPREPPLSVISPSYASNDHPNVQGESSGAPPSSPSTLGPVPRGPRPEFAKLDIELEIVHEGPVLRARCMPQKPSLIATRTLTEDVLVYDYKKYQNIQHGKPEFGPELRLKGHNNLGKGLSWNPNRPGHLLSASEDRTVCLWDVNATPNQNHVVDVTTTYTGHSAEVRDVSWHRKDINVFGSVSDDSKAMIWDVRSHTTNQSVHVIEEHILPVNTISFNNFNENTFLTAGVDSVILLWDLRFLGNPVKRFADSPAEVTKVLWSPNNEMVFASCGKDRKVRLWNLSRSGTQLPPDVEGSPELMFVHGGAITSFADFDWNPIEPGLICSVPENSNILQVWQMADNLLNYQEFNYRCMKEHLDNFSAFRLDEPLEDALNFEWNF